MRHVRLLVLPCFAFALLRSARSGLVRFVFSSMSYLLRVFGKTWKTLAQARLVSAVHFVHRCSAFSDGRLIPVVGVRRRGIEPRVSLMGCAKSA
jgi:hypothetical protein